MKIQLDTKNKTITIEEDVNLHDFYESLNSILPDGKWREFTLKVTRITEWRNPITITPNVPNTPNQPGVPNTDNPYDIPGTQIWYGTNSGDVQFINYDIK